MASSMGGLLGYSRVSTLEARPQGSEGCAGYHTVNRSGHEPQRVWPLPAYGATIISGDNASPEGVAETRGEARWTPESSSAIWSPI